MAFSASDKSAGPIFAAQPQVRESPVKVLFSHNKDMIYHQFIMSVSAAKCSKEMHQGFLNGSPATRQITL